ncbi:MAG: hypothetical protein UHH87_10660 [Akkermansia sp.]|nr:hypothetical protein [Akkermansia sp.]
MFKHFIKDIAARKAMILFSDTLLGRAMLRKGVELASRELGIPLDVQPDSTDREFWHIRAGAPTAPLCVHIRVHAEALAELIEFGANAWLEGRKLHLHRDILPLLAKHMQSTKGTLPASS